MEQAKVDWSVLPDDLLQAVRPIADGGNYDEAIFTAFKYVEAEIQDRIHSRSVGATLIAEAFDGARPKIMIGMPSDRPPVQAMFTGALGFIRNDRGHKKKPAVPCRSLRECMWFLNHAALLLYLLSKDEALRARVDTISVDNGRIQFHGANLGRTSEVKAADTSVQILQISEPFVEAALPPNFVGEVQLYSDDELVGERQCDARNLYGVYPGVYEVIDVEVPLFADPVGNVSYSEYVGLRLRLYEAGKVYYRISPTTPGRYKKGQFVRDTSWDMSVVIGQTWYRDIASGQIRNAWSSSALFMPDEMWSAPAPQLSTLVALPSVVSLEPGDVVTLRARGIESIGDARQEIDLTEDATWKSADPSVAYVKGGILYGKKLGSTVVHCSAKGFQSNVSVGVENHARGDRSIYFEGLRLACQIGFDRYDNLYITNQSNRIHRLSRRDGLEIALQLPNEDGTSYQIDCLAVDAEGGLHFTAPYPRRVMSFPRDGSGYGVGQPVGPDDETPKRSLAISADLRIVVGVMGLPGTGHVLQIYPDGRETTFRTRDSAHNLALGRDGNIYVASPSHREIDIYSSEGTLLDSLAYDVADSVGAVAVGADLSVYVALFNSGQLIRLKREASRIECIVLATNLGNPDGIGLDSRQRVYVSDFSSGRIYVLW